MLLLQDAVPTTQSVEQVKADLFVFSSSQCTPFCSSPQQGHYYHFRTETASHRHLGSSPNVLSRKNSWPPTFRNLPPLMLGRRDSPSLEPFQKGKAALQYQQEKEKGSGLQSWIVKRSSKPSNPSGQASPAPCTERRKWLPEPGQGAMERKTDSS